MIENATFENVYAAVCPVSWAVCVCVCALKESIYYIVIITGTCVS